MGLTSTSFKKPQSGFIEAASGTGLAVTGNANMTPSIAAGNYWVGGIRVIYAGGTTTLATADPTNARIDLITADQNGTITSVTGTPAATPVAPFAPDNRIILARIAVAAATASITNSNITDLRDFGGLSTDGTTLTVSAAGVLSVVQAGLTGIPITMFSQSGQTVITGNGAEQNVWSKTFSAANWASGDIMRITLITFQDRSGVALGYDIALYADATALWTKTGEGGTDPQSYYVNAIYSGNTTSTSSFSHTDNHTTATSNRVGVTLAQAVANEFGASMPVKFTVNAPATTTVKVDYVVLIEKITGGVSV